MRFTDLHRDCYHQLKAWGYSLETVETYDRTWVQFLTFLKARGLPDSLRSFNDDSVLAWADELKRMKAHPNSVIRMLSALSTLARYAMMRKDEHEHRLLAQDPTKSFRWPTAQRTETKYLYPEELAKLLDVQAEPHERLARDLLFDTGIRVGEAARLSVGDFKQNGGRYYLSVSVKSRGNQRRVSSGDIPIGKALGDAIRDAILERGWVDSRDADKPILVDSRGLRWKRFVLSNMIARLALRAGITRFRVSAHKLRHTREVIDRQAKIDAPTRARLRLRSSVRSLDRYEHVLPDELGEAKDIANEGTQRYLDRFPINTEDTSGAQKDQAVNAKRDAELDDS